MSTELAPRTTFPRKRVSVIELLVPIWTILFLLLAVCPARADEIEDAYLGIMGIIDQADALAATNQAVPARAKYREAQVALVAFKNNYGNWNARAVNYRLKYLAGKIAATPVQPAPAVITTAESPAQAGKTPPKPASLVKLLASGAEPRKVLRLHPNAGDTQSVSLTMKVGMAMSVG